MQAILRAIFRAIFRVGAGGAVPPRSFTLSIVLIPFSVQLRPGSDYFAQRPRSDYESH